MYYIVNERCAHFEILVKEARYMGRTVCRTAGWLRQS